MKILVDSVPEHYSDCPFGTPMGNCLLHSIIYGGFPACQVAEDGCPYFKQFNKDETIC